MSFILDALRKSEHERQNQGPTEYAGIPTSSAPTSTPRWLLLVGALLAINLAVLAGVLLRPDSGPAAAVSGAATRIDTEQQATEAGSSTFADRVAAAQQEIPQQPPVSIEKSTPTLAEPDLISQNPESIDRSSLYSTYQEVVASGAINVAPLHLDIHVYSTTPADRFVFINMSKHREGSRLDEGPLVGEIRADGVVLEHRGVTFLLQRE